MTIEIGGKNSDVGPIQCFKTYDAVYVCKCMHVYIYVCVYVYMCVYICMYACICIMYIACDSSRPFILLEARLARAVFTCSVISKT